MAIERVNVVTVEGVVPLELGDDERSVAASHVNAATIYRDTGDASRLTDFQGARVGGYELETRPGEIERLSTIGELDFEDFYEG